MSSRLFFSIIIAALSVTVGCNKSETLTPEQVRAQLDDPTGSVDDGSMIAIADDWFGAGSALEAEDMAGVLKTSQSRRRRTGTPLDVILAPEVLDHALSFGVGSTIVDIFCVTSLIADIQEFDDCETGDTCEVEFTIDSCILRIGENGDPEAAGSITFTLSETSTAEYDRGELSIEFDGWQFTDGNVVDYTDGLLALEVTEWKTEDRDEIIYSVDLIQKHIDPDEDGLFSDGATWENRARAAMRLTTLTEGATDSVTLEILCFVDLGNDGTQEDTLVITLDYTQTQVSTDVTSATLTLQVRGTNGSFTCSWQGAIDEQGEDTTGYHSEGTCVDDETGETFNWNGTHTVTTG
jgi:hypothetical protein